MKNKVTPISTYKKIFQNSTFLDLFLKTNLLKWLFYAILINTPNFKFQK